MLVLIFIFILVGASPMLLTFDATSVPVNARKVNVRHNIFPSLKIYSQGCANAVKRLKYTYTQTKYSVLLNGNIRYHP